jgi:hypothetical protein
LLSGRYKYFDVASAVISSAGKIDAARERLTLERSVRLKSDTMVDATREVSIWQRSLRLIFDKAMEAIR